MSDEKDTVEPEAPKKKPAAKKAVSSKATYVGAEGRAVTVPNGIADAGMEISADDVADIEALIKGGYVVKA